MHVVIHSVYFLHVILSAANRGILPHRYSPCVIDSRPGICGVRVGPERVESGDGEALSATKRVVMVHDGVHNADDGCGVSLPPQVSADTPPCYSVSTLTWSLVTQHADARR